tara:strand:+ start:1443 stop:3680 length:2238 start_codon:yes stop_codon:yes gene_type:complete
MQKRIIWGLVLLSCNLPSQYIYEANQDLFQLQKNANNFEGELAYSVGDDQLSTSIDLTFNFTFYGQTFDKARMATNGCLHFGLGTGNVNYNNYCGDYTPDPIGSQYTYTMFPFWTDLIRDSNSRMKSWGDNTKMIFGWYDMREYNRNSDNSFEVILYPNNSFEYRYDELDIINHDVIIGEVGANSTQVYQYLFHDECNTGTTNTSSCVNTNWNNTSFNTLLEGGGSLYGVGSGNGLDCSDPLNNSSCAGYADAFLTQQCNINQLYSESCPSYWSAYDDQQCDEDPQYAPFCPGFRQEESVAFFDDRNVDFGFVDEQEQFATGIFIDDGHHHHEEEPFVVIDVFEEEMFPPFEEFGHDDFEDFFGEPEEDEFIIFFEPEPLPFVDNFHHRHEDPLHQEDILLEQFVLQETLFVEDFSEPENFLAINTIEELDDWFEEETREIREEIREERIVERDEPEEEFIEEIFEEEAVEEVFEELEEVFEELEEERLAEVEEENNDEVLEELEIIENDEPTSKSKNRSIALKVIKNALNTASNSVNYGSTSSQTNSSGVINSVTNTGNTSSSSAGGISTSSSPSISDQYASATAQNNQVLSMSSGVGGVSVSITPIASVDGGSEVVMADVQVQNVQGQIDTAVGGVMTQSEADQIADKIIAQNIEQQQEEMQEEQQATGEYGDESSLVALIGYVPQFNTYTQLNLPDQQSWYSSEDIYSNIVLDDNINAFYNYASTNINNLQNMIDDQPNIWR